MISQLVQLKKPEDKSTGSSILIYKRLIVSKPSNFRNILS